MKALTVFFILALSLNTYAGVAFKCKSELSQFEVVQGYYNGEADDSIDLKNNTVFGIANFEGGKTLNLARLSKNRSKGLLKDLDVQFESKQIDDGTTYITVFAMPMGIFGGNIGKQFDAALADKYDQHALQCEIVSSVDL